MPIVPSPQQALTEEEREWIDEAIGGSSRALEGITPVIQWVKKIARGFRNPEHSRSPSTFTAEDSISTHTKAGRAV
jgi:hypothetical protein